MKRLKSYTMSEVLEELQKKGAARIKKFEESGGMCDHCEKELADASGWDPMLCSACNAKTEEILKKLRGPGFHEIRVPIKKRTP